MNKRFMCLFISLILVFPLFACGGKDTPSNNAQDNSSMTDSEQLAQSNETQETTSEKIIPKLPEKDFGGHIFTFLLKGDNYNEWASLDIASEGEDGEIINDAVYNRNRFVEETYNVKIAWNRNNDPNAAFNKTFNAGDNTYDAFMPDLPSAANFAQKSMLYDLKEMSYIDLSNPWWDSKAVKELSISNKLFYCVSDISYTAIDTIWIMMFNKNLVQTYGLEDPYEIVKRGEWTFEKLNEMIKDITRDLDANGIIDENDIVGFVSPADRYVRAMLLAAGESFTEKTSDDFFMFKQPSENFINIYDKAMDLMHSNPDVLDINDIKDKGSSYLTNKYFLAKKMFEENRILFFSEVMQNIVRLRQMNTEFGIIPLPKQTIEQTATPHYVFVDTTTVISVPANCPDPERTAVILEAMAAESHYTLLPAYYEIALKTKLARDEKSGEMMDIILANRTYDLASVYNFGGIYSAVSTAITGNKISYQTAIEKIQSRIDRDIEKITEQYK